MPVQPDTFRKALGHFASGVTVVTMASDVRKTGLTVSAFSSVSLEPPLILVCINKDSNALDLLRETKVFAVNFLASDQTAVSNQFASRTDDKFQSIPYHASPMGAPILDHALGYVECTLVQEVEAGDHCVYIGQVESADVDDSKQPLLYYHGRYESLAAADARRS